MWIAACLAAHFWRARCTTFTFGNLPAAFPIEKGIVPEDDPAPQPLAPLSFPPLPIVRKYYSGIVPNIRTISTFGAFRKRSIHIISTLNMHVSPRANGMQKPYGGNLSFRKEALDVDKGWAYEHICRIHKTFNSYHWPVVLKGLLG